MLFVANSFITPEEEAARVLPHRTVWCRLSVNVAVAPRAAYGENPRQEGEQPLAILDDKRGLLLATSMSTEFPHSLERRSRDMSSGLRVSSFIHQVAWAWSERIGLAWLDVIRVQALGNLVCGLESAEVHCG